MTRIIGIRTEDKNEWEKRAPLTPQDVAALQQEHQIHCIVQPSPIRIFSNEEYQTAGADVQNDLSACPTILAIKEIPEHLFQKGKTYIFFSHTIKGQAHNMPLLKTMMERGCTLIDYEKITNDQGRRLIFFGNYAGYAGMIDTLWALGQRWTVEGKTPNPFAALNHTYTYGSLEHAQEAMRAIGRQIADEGLPAEAAPVIIGITGYGNVSKAAQSVLDLLPTIEIPAKQIHDVFTTQKHDRHHVYKVVFKEEDMVHPRRSDLNFELQDYYQHPEKYDSSMNAYLPYMTVLVNCIYWEAKYPRVLTRDFLKQSYSNGNSSALTVVGDISCDIEGGIECTVDATKPDQPTFVYDPLTDQITPGVAGRGVVVMAVDNLPCELSRESSSAFSSVLKAFIPDLVKADFTQPLNESGLPEPLKRAVILYHGALTESYKYLTKYL